MARTRWAGAEQRRRPRQQRSRATVGLALEAAAQLFAELGYDGTTTNAVAERAGISVGSLYQYYSGKDALLLALADEHLGQVHERLRELVHERWAGEPALCDVAASLVRTVIAANTSNPRLTRLLHRESPRTPELTAHLEAVRTGLAVEVANHLERHGLPPGVASLRARVAVEAVEHIAHGVALDPPPGQDVTGVTEETVRLVQRYLEDTSPV